MKTVLILCNGKPPSQELFHEYRANADYFIAADGGANIALAWDTFPDVVIGDLDSFKGNGDAPFEIIFRPSQQSNDLEKALSHAQKEHGTHINILGATGHRLDQTLKNLSVLKKYDTYFEQILLIDDFGKTQLLSNSFTSPITVGTQVSLFPLSGRVSGITTNGLKYPLDNETLENGVRDGSSNEVVDSPIEITHKKGDLLLYTKHFSD
ncbi:thiamine diphosphokinase [Fodinibius sp. Rm-B-1B1-1]|uniref:thiamine diphosphokinase n=1 Tax=Fodinibius alkaliphilus TaxID=3140241 RepID=UPI00315ACA0C